jgi:hypothetical protein
MSEPITPLDFNPFEGDFGDQGDKTLTDTMVKARKPHFCSHCAGDIAVGELHRSRADIADGEFMRWRWCALCCEAMVLELVGQDDDGDEPYPFERRHNIARTSGATNA